MEGDLEVCNEQRLLEGEVVSDEAAAGQGRNKVEGKRTGRCSIRILNEIAAASDAPITTSNINTPQVLNI